MILSSVCFLSLVLSPCRRRMKGHAPPPPQLPQPAPRHMFRNFEPDSGRSSALDGKENMLRPTVNLQLTLPRGNQMPVTEDGRWVERRGPHKRAFYHSNSCGFSSVALSFRCTCLKRVRTRMFCSHMLCCWITRCWHICLYVIIHQDKDKNVHPCLADVCNSTS